MATLRSLLFLLWQSVTVIPFAIVSLLILPLPLHFRFRVIVWWPRLIVWGAKVLCGIRWQMIGTENLPDGPCVLLSKHESAWETLFIVSHMPREVCFVYKRSLHWVPFFGWGLASLRMIHIDRNQGRHAFESVVSQGSQRLAEGRWIIMFPEGTRVPVGEYRPYKQGGSRLASQLKVPVVPIAHNAGTCWPRNSFTKVPGLVTVSIGPQIPSAGKTSDALMVEVERWIEHEMRQLSPARYPDEAARVAA
jgi:1-acyl-sn-glycerol-3-phosphate acyltransferase